MDLNWTAVTWGALALLLIVAEILIPGAYLLWLGLAAAGMFLLTLFVADVNLLLQVLIFAFLSVAFIRLYQAKYRNRLDHSDQPLLNRRAQQLIGQSYVLDTDLRDGRGTVRVGDAMWSVHGPDLPMGTHVRVVAIDGMYLVVEPDTP